MSSQKCHNFFFLYFHKYSLFSILKRLSLSSPYTHPQNRLVHFSPRRHHSHLNHKFCHLCSALLSTYNIQCIGRLVNFWDSLTRFFHPRSEQHLSATQSRSFFYVPLDTVNALHSFFISVDQLTSLSVSFYLTCLQFFLSVRNATLIHCPESHKSAKHFSTESPFWGWKEK